MYNLPSSNPVDKITVGITAKKHKPAPAYFQLTIKNVLYFSSIVLLTFFSCTPAKNTTYFQNIQRDTTLRNLITKNLGTKIQKNDLLQITVAGLSPDIAIFNAPQDASGGLTGYLVDDSGEISFIKLGIIKVAGMTKKELKALLEKSLVPYLKEVVVSVGIANRHVTMMGAVSPQVLPITVENMTILDALASSGDIGEKGRTDNILVIREKEDGKEFKRLNLTDSSIFYSPYFYLQPNDVVYVEPSNIKKGNTAQIISYITAGISFVFLILNQVFR